MNRVPLEVISKSPPVCGGQGTWPGDILRNEQRGKIGTYLLSPKPRSRGNRPRVDDRRCVEGILWVLWIRAPWNELLRQ
ncbi:transposase [Candidatus Parcubacteria bacterium]|nr:MAG: transposase [Candidatus Parcubacteria bacterium]